MSATPVKTDNIGGIVQRLESSYMTALPKHVTKEQFGRALLTAFRQTPKLAECTPQSIGAAVVTAAQLGLMIGVNGSCWLVPYKQECQLIIGYQGLVDLAYRSGRVGSITSDVVCENDLFEFEQGLDQKLRHKPCMTGPRGRIYAVYAIATLKDSKDKVFVVLTEDEVMKVKNASRGAGSASSPWNGDFRAEMWKKTAVRRLVKLLPKSVELMEALEFENREDAKWAQARQVDNQDPYQPGRHRLVIDRENVRNLQEDTVQATVKDNTNPEYSIEG